MSKKKILIYDLETNSVDPLVAEPKLGGFKSTEFEGFKYTSSIKEMVAMINSHDIIIGYNNKGYDNVIMERYGANFFGKISVDLYVIADMRRMLIKVGKKYLHGLMRNRSMDLLSEILGGPPKLTGDVDYAWFKQDFNTLSEEIQKKCIIYLERDIEMTEHIYDWMEEYFADFKEYLKPEQIERKQYLTASTASLAYKCLCNLANIEERYADDDPVSYGGGFVALPTREAIEGNLYCLDFSSLYPHIMMMCNLYGRVTDGNPHGRKTWKGSGVFATTGEYYADELAPVSKVLQDLYQKRLLYKAAGDGREYTIKIIINTIYGLLGKSVFASVNDFVAADDCTKLGRQWIKYARLKFKEAGYEVVYTDTDSVYIDDPYNDKEKMLALRDKMIEFLQKGVAFPQETFDMTIDDEIKFMMFGKALDGTILKKNYLYVTHENNLMIKGLQLIKGTATKLGNQIFAEMIKPDLISNHKHKWLKSEITDAIYTKLEEDLSLAGTTLKVREAELYKSPSQLQRQIAEHPSYGPGQHTMIKVRAAHPKGVGVNQNYVGDQFKDDINPWHVVIDKTIEELRPFTDSSQNPLDGWLK